MTFSNLTQSVGSFVRAVSGRRPESATPMEFWMGLSEAIMERIADNWQATTDRYAVGRQEHYFSAEFLMGRALLNNLTNLGLINESKEALAAYGTNLTEVLEAEHDAALGNGGLGRLAACFLDSCATLNLPVTGYGILYRYGLFKQSFENGFQVESPDPWMEEGYPFVIRREEEQVKVTFADMTVRAIPYDMPITGYGTKNVGTLRLWKSEPMEEFDYEAFNSQRFTDAIVERERVADLCRVLYPNDTTYEGKLLRLRQQYFFTSASLQQIIANYVKQHGTDFSDFAAYNCIQLNDTHPVIGIPELMRLLMDDHGQTWDDAFEIVSNTFAFTNHTTLAEALETWPVNALQQIAPRILEIIYEIDRRFRIDMAEKGLDEGEINYLAPVSEGTVHMAWIACYCSFSINGVAAIHTEILKADTLAGWYRLYPQKFSNKTNGVTPRRWLNQCNPKLAALLTRVSGSDSWVSDMDQLAGLDHFMDDANVMNELRQIKAENKIAFANWIKNRDGITVNPEAIFDVQIKRLHEYKRQLLNVLYIIDLYFRVKDDPSIIKTPRLFVFGAKAAPGYRMAKGIIKLANEVARVVNDDPAVNELMQVLFIENYNVTPAEMIIPAADISEQISTAGKEASGTSNMKFMMNGALTLGTMDGATVEIVAKAGEENAYIFGARVEELPALRQGYSAQEKYMTVPGLKRTLDSLMDGTFTDNNTGMFHDIFDSLVNPNYWGGADIYYVLGDFESYRETKDRMFNDYEDQHTWARKVWKNIIESRTFSSDRTIRDYATEIWKITPERI